jgi:hypothetical protein
VRDEELTIDFLNRELMSTVQQLGGKEDVGQRLEAIRLGYVVTGKIQNGSTRLLDTPPPSMPGALHDPESQPPERFDYRALIQVIPQTPVPIVADQEERPAVDRGQTPQPVTGPQKNSGPVNKPTPQSPREEPTRKPKDGLPPPIRCG